MQGSALANSGHYDRYHRLSVRFFPFSEATPSKPIALALVDAQNRCVNVRVVADKKSNGEKYTAVTYLANHRVPVRLNDKYAIMHNKFMIVDGHSIETGSFNYTKSAAFRNADMERSDGHKTHILEHDVG